MCTIEKMLIKGIRSFSPDNEVVIEFFKVAPYAPVYKPPITPYAHMKPLTLIVGANGAGKTVRACHANSDSAPLSPNVLPNSHADNN